MIKIFIGYDTRETVAWHVAAHSIIRRTRMPVSITPIGNSTLPKSIWWRERGSYDSTEFSNARFLVPHLCDYRGLAVFVDCDVLWLTDISALIESIDPRAAVSVVKHNYVPDHSRKFLDQPQTRYRRKNWSSLMVFNCDHPSTRNLTVDYVNKAAGLDLHGFAWCIDEDIGSLPESWNHLVKHRSDKHAAA